ncbi:MAG: lactococcin 972 family bacteriocin [Anaerococcus sp.]|nr:lactococcin 972 family bacteriocin [Anaerococcus sp.]
MKKMLYSLLLSVILLQPTTRAFAKEENLPYVENLGYQVEVVDNNISLYSYDSGWKSFLGGSWIHGVNTSSVRSQFDHNSKTHKTTVQGKGGKYSYSGWVSPRRRASASWEKAFTGNQAWADVK